MLQGPNKAIILVTAIGLLTLGFLLTLIKYSPEIAPFAVFRCLSPSTLEICRKTFLITSSFLLSILAAKYLWSVEYPKWISGCFALGVALRLLYFFCTPFEDTPYDLGGHLEYLTHSAHSWTLPAAKNGWEFYHPPLYYWIVSFVINLFHFQNLIVIKDGEVALLASLVFSVVTLTFIFKSSCSLFSILNCKDILL